MGAPTPPRWNYSSAALPFVFPASGMVAVNGSRGISLSLERVALDRPRWERAGRGWDFIPVTPD